MRADEDEPNAGDRHIEMRVQGGVQRVDKIEWAEFYASPEVHPLVETLTRVIRQKLFDLRDATRAQIERLCGAQLRMAGMAAPDGMFEARGGVCPRGAFECAARGAGALLLTISATVRPNFRGRTDESAARLGSKRSSRRT